MPDSANMLSKTFAFNSDCFWLFPSKGAIELKFCKLSLLCSDVVPVLATPFILLLNLAILELNFAILSLSEVTNFSIRFSPAFRSCWISDILVIAALAISVFSAISFRAS